MACKRCGQCCAYAIFPLAGITRENDPQGLARYFEAHHCKIFDGEECLMVRIPLMCGHLEFDTASGQAFCLIHDERPQICRDFFCDAAKEEKPGK